MRTFVAPRFVDLIVLLMCTIPTKLHINTVYITQVWRQWSEIDCVYSDNYFRIYIGMQSHMVMRKYVD